MKKNCHLPTLSVMLCLLFSVLVATAQDISPAPPVAYPPSTTLPVNFTTITAAIKNNMLTVKWMLMTETKEGRFNIEVSHNGDQFIKVGSLDAHTGANALQLAYSFSTSLTGFQRSLMGVPLVLLLGLTGLKRRKDGIFSAVMVLFLCGALYGCSKSPVVVQESEIQSVFVRIEQVEKDNTNIYSKVIRVVAE
ncbi:hypothetical protein [Niabella beijingensis]|uniref:hypothetical protein n=1 Tax=Niabella beijingensis TaxID=2872700 RepID=UPI001CBBD733|nr:hypothetical protein [Niabella beijingensis]MBZ4189843.1 hypothetical protein [Niabella beijingensis]